LEEYSVAAHVRLLYSIRSLSRCADYADRFRSARRSSYFVVPFIKRLLSQIYKFPQSSLAELARNSVIQSGFEMEVKRHWLGHHWYLPGDAGNEINKVRLASCSFRHPVLCISVSCILIADHSMHFDVGSAPAFLDERPEQPTRVQTPNATRRVGHGPWWRAVRAEGLCLAASFLDVYQCSLSVNALTYLVPL